MKSSKIENVVLKLDKNSLAILDRLRGEMSPSDFIRLLLQIADSGAVTELPENLKRSRRR